MKIFLVLVSCLLVLLGCAPTPSVQESASPEKIPVIDATGEFACIADWQVTPKNDEQLFAIYSSTSDGSYSQFNLNEAMLLLRNSEYNEDMRTGLCAYSIVFGLNAGPLPGLEIFNDLVVEHQLTADDLRCREE